MSTKTTNFGFTKPELTDASDITQQNENWDILDAELREHKLKTYTSFEELGLIRGKETISGICTALPVGSCLVVRVDVTCNASVYPTSFSSTLSGLLKVTRPTGIGLVTFEFWYKVDAANKSNVEYWYGASALGGDWSGWKEVAKTSDLSNFVQTSVMSNYLTKSTITKGTTDLEAGVSALATDSIYLVYE